MNGSEDLRNWLPETLSNSSDRYRHRLFVEDADSRSKIIDQLKQYFINAHEDVRRHLREVVNNSLDPLGEPSTFDPAEGYPEKLHNQTLKGYLGEVFAGLISEMYSPHGEAWKVPVFLFRFHDVALDQLDFWRQTGQAPGKIPGRFGEDCVAFQRNEQGKIVRSLICEAKCTSNHNRTLINNAHEQISSRNLFPIDLRKIIEILKDYNDDESIQWVNALQFLYLNQNQAEYERCDLVTYVHGQVPIRNQTWIPNETPHDRYSGNRRLEAAEIRLSDVDSLIQLVYQTTEDLDDGTD